ncbi:MAG: bifunctional folylpolyglutamate synthase/dihydrofolate synthase [Oscillospiraceae bacterium]|nr:bifunctional folylpolyglutamate synthase/dihydrofolate synthase [Oscillospiraceae bacterium]
MNYNEALSYIHSVCWKGSVPGLSRTTELLRRVGHPERTLKFVHIAGTNGKGSTAAMLASILEEAGFTVGLYTSPFINRFNERMQVNHSPISDEELSELTAWIRPHADTMDDAPTEFELITVLALEFFRRRRCDIVILEVGMGGALDSTNVIDAPEAAVITALGMDHVRELGPTLADIARAKAGIIKAGCHVVSYGGSAEADPVIEAVCLEKGAVLHRPDFDRIVPGDFSLSGQDFSYGDYTDLHIPLAGVYQLRNAAVAITAAEVLQKRGWHVTAEHIRRGLAATRWPARFEVLRRDPVFIVDGGHNPHGIQATADSLQRIFPDRKFVFVTGVMADKDVESILGLLAPMAERFYTVTPDNPRAMKADLLAQRIGALGATALPCASVADGVAQAMAFAGADGVVCAVGSLYMSGEVRECFLQE